MNNDHDMMYTRHDHNSYHNDDDPQVENIVDDQRCPQLNTGIARYNHGHICASSSDDSGNETEGGGGGIHGGGGGFAGLMSSPESSPAPSDDGMDVDGEEGLELFKRTQSLHALHLLAHNTRRQRLGILPDEEDYLQRFSVSPSLSGSMQVEDNDTLSMSMSIAQLSSLSATTRSTSPSGFLAFAGQGMVESGTIRPMPGVHYFTDMPIFLAHERAFCFNMQIGVEPPTNGRQHQYPSHLSINDGNESARSEFSYYDLF